MLKAMWRFKGSSMAETTVRGSKGRMLTLLPISNLLHSHHNQGRIVPMWGQAYRPMEWTRICRNKLHIYGELISGKEVKTASGGKNSLQTTVLRSQVIEWSLTPWSQYIKDQLKVNQKPKYKSFRNFRRQRKNKSQPSCVRQWFLKINTRSTREQHFKVRQGRHYQNKNFHWKNAMKISGRKKQKMGRNASKSCLVKNINIMWS